MKRTLVGLIGLTSVSISWANSSDDSQLPDDIILSDDGETFQIPLDENIDTPDEFTTGLITYRQVGQYSFRG